MIEYRVEVWRRSEIQSEQDFWKLYKKYDGGGLSIPELSSELMGECMGTRISSDSPLTLKNLREEFPNISIRKLEPVTSHS